MLWIAGHNYVSVEKEPQGKKEGLEGPVAGTYGVYLRSDTEQGS